MCKRLVRGCWLYVYILICVFMYSWLNGQQSIIYLSKEVVTIRLKLIISALCLLLCYTTALCSSSPPLMLCSLCCIACMRRKIESRTPTCRAGAPNVVTLTSTTTSFRRHSLCVTSRVCQTSIDGNDIFLPDHSLRRANTLLFETALPPCYSASGNSIAKRVPYAHCF